MGYCRLSINSGHGLFSPIMRLGRWVWILLLTLLRPSDSVQLGSQWSFDHLMKSCGGQRWEGLAIFAMGRACQLRLGRGNLV